MTNIIKPRALVMKGDIKEVCKHLANEATRCKGMTVAGYLNYINLKKVVDKQIEGIIDALEK